MPHAPACEEPRRRTPPAPIVLDVARTGRADTPLHQDTVKARHESVAEPCLEGAIGLVLDDGIRDEAEAQTASKEPICEVRVLDADEALVESADGERMLAPHGTIRRVEEPPAGAAVAREDSGIAPLEHGGLPVEPRSERVSCWCGHPSGDGRERVPRVDGEVALEEPVLRHDVIVEEEEHVGARRCDRGVSGRCGALPPLADGAQRIGGPHRCEERVGPVVRPVVHDDDLETGAARVLPLQPCEKAGERAAPVEGRHDDTDVEIALDLAGGVHGGIWTRRRVEVPSAAVLSHVGATASGSGQRPRRGESGARRVNGPAHIPSTTRS